MDHGIGTVTLFIEILLSFKNAKYKPAFSRLIRDRRHFWCCLFVFSTVTCTLTYRCMECDLCFRPAANNNTNAITGTVLHFDHNIIMIK